MRRVETIFRPEEIEKRRRLGGVLDSGEDRVRRVSPPCGAGASNLRAHPPALAGYPRLESRRRRRSPRFRSPIQRRPEKANSYQTEIDENYHPAALRENIAALRMRYPRSRIVVALQPRYTGGRSGFQSATLPAALAAADVVILSRPFDLKPFPGGKFSSRSVLAKLRTLGRQTHFIRSLRGLNKFVPRVIRPGDVLHVSLPSGCEFITLPLTEIVRKLTSA